uniref:Uncharacterized protein n=1 Tax=Corethron hystrix TaxID=216773 RepID=A0A7S1BYH4_9STRA|mmetsp:Transcript_5314/g.10854  ORF Transcript_5314/g.10854 Transcript_5314/m.10854 type:complete len:261 (+) Transcript_5314:485-1267(+)
MALQKEAEDQLDDIKNIIREKNYLKKRLEELDQERTRSQDQLSNRYATIAEIDRTISELLGEKTALENAAIGLNEDIRALQDRSAALDQDIAVTDDRIVAVRADSAALAASRARKEGALARNNERLERDRQGKAARLARTLRAQEREKEGILGDLARCAQLVQDPEGLRRALKDLAVRCAAGAEEEEEERGETQEAEGEEEAAERDEEEKELARLQEDLEVRRRGYERLCLQHQRENHEAIKINMALLRELEKARQENGK